METRNGDDALPAVDELSRKIAAFVCTLIDTRESLDSDQLADLASPRARLEVGLDAVDAWLFSIDGVLQGRKVEGALLAGECMLVRAKSERGAIDLANAGLRSTVKLLHQEYLTRGARDKPVIEIEAAGRRAQGGKPMQPEIMAMLRKAFEEK